MKKKVCSVDISFSDLKYTVPAAKSKDKKVVLKSINGKFKSGEISAIMGPSGAGKSTLMNILTGFVQNGVSGNIDFGALPKSRNLCCYIRQDDHFFPWMTVDEVMLLAATLKISNKSMNIKEKHMLVENILDTLGLSSTKQTRCSKLSGGQKKRLSIALELIDNPPIMFLDEPTTGLDSSTSYDTCYLLTKLAEGGRTIVCTIHQPSSTIYEMFQHIYVLQSGECVYQGTPQNTVQFLKKINLECPSYHNPADFLLECVNGEHGDYKQPMIEEAKCTNTDWRSNIDIESSSSAQLIKLHDMKSFDTFNVKFSGMSQTHTYPPPEWFRLWVLIGRCHMQVYRDWSVTYLKFALHIICAITVGLIFGDAGSNATKAISNIGLFIIAILYLWYTTLMPGILRFPMEIQIIKKETFNRWYTLGSFYLANLITSTPVHILFSSIFSCIIYLMTDQPFEIERFVKFVLIIIAVTLAADGCGLLLGSILNPINGTFIGAVLSSYMLLFSGFLILFEHMSTFMRIVSYSSTLRYALESIVLSIHGNNREDTRCPEDAMYCHFKNSNMLLKNMGMINGDYTFNVIMLLFQITLFKGLAYLTLKRKLLSQ